MVGILLVLKLQKIYEKKLLNFAHHHDFENSNLPLTDLKKKLKKKMFFMTIIKIKKIKINGLAKKLKKIENR